VRQARFFAGNHPNRTEDDPQQPGQGKPQQEPFVHRHTERAENEGRESRGEHDRREPVRPLLLRDCGGLAGKPAPHHQQSVQSTATATATTIAISMELPSFFNIRAYFISICQAFLN